MTVIYRLSDRIKVRIDDITISLAPMSFAVKSEIQGHVQKGVTDGDTNQILIATQKAIKHTVKDIEGVTLPDGSGYKLEFDGDVLTDGAVEELLNFPYAQPIATVTSSLANGVPKEFTDPDGNPIAGVEIIPQPDLSKAPKPKN